MCSRIIQVICFMLVTTGIKSQVNLVYNIGVIGNAGATQQIYSGPVFIDGKQCFEISNGLKTFVQLNNGPFLSNCLEFLDKTEIRYRAFPNPTASYVILQTTIYAQFNDGEKFLVEVSDMLGRVLMSDKTDLNSLNAGYRISTARLSSGTYNIKVVSGSTKMQVVKIIKVPN